MSRPHQYIALVSSLPHLGKLFSRKDVPISGFRLKQRLSMLEPAHASLLREMVEVTAWAGVAGYDRDIDVIRRAKRFLPIWLPIRICNTLSGHAWKRGR